ncbi:hypothetical protein ACFO0N_12325 [Halobium salinum]|uniref:Uncharacterized protein n=1 Tax=Halobium salinum TaxID=1364940 RepID=A0ABD5PDE3_9EURY|nr:hypothetical protein [Halobium salinum]
MTDYGCPHCGAPYLRTASSDEQLTGELRLPDVDHERVCYKARVTPEAYFGFTLYFHPGTVYRVEARESPDSGWELPAERDVYASRATAEDRRGKLVRLADDPEYEVRIREIPLAEARTRGP